MQDPAMGQEQPQEPQEGAGGYTICIHVAGDNSLSVSVEGLEPETAGPEGSMGDQQEDMQGAQPAPDIKTALTLALAAYKSDGKLPDLAGQDAEFDKGFGAGPGEGAMQ
jgi:hypothetical protein